MTIVSAFLVPGSPLPHLCPDVPQWNHFRLAMREAGKALHASRPDVVLLYSTQWLAVLDEIWLTRQRSEDIHVDETWHEFGELPYDLYSDVSLANACIEACQAQDIHARGADYQGFPIDTGSIVAASALEIGTQNLPVVLASNNLYDSAETVEKLAAIAVNCAAEQGKRVAVVGVGGLSGSQFRNPIEPGDDHIFSAEEDALNRQILALIETGNIASLREQLPRYARQARVDMGFKHFHWLLGAVGGTFTGANILHYGAIYGSGAAVIELRL